MAATALERLAGELRRLNGERDRLQHGDAKVAARYMDLHYGSDVHIGICATIGSVIPTKGAVIPAAVGVDIGCGMMAAHTPLVASDLPDNLESIRSAIEQAVPHGRVVGRGKRNTSSWGDPPRPIVDAWATLVQRFERLC